MGYAAQHASTTTQPRIQLIQPHVSCSKSNCQGGNREVATSLDQVPQRQVLPAVTKYSCSFGDVIKSVSSALVAFIFGTSYSLHRWQRAKAQAGL